MTSMHRNPALPSAGSFLCPDGQTVRTSDLVPQPIMPLDLPVCVAKIIEAKSGIPEQDCHRAVENQPLMGASKPATPCGWLC